MQSLDHALIRAYASFGKPADRIAATLTLRDAFLRHVPPDLRVGGDDAVIWRLLQLRKSGQLPTTRLGRPNP